MYFWPCNKEIFDWYDSSRTVKSSINIINFIYLTLHCDARILSVLKYNLVHLPLFTMNKTLVGLNGHLSNMQPPINRHLNRSKCISFFMRVNCP